MLTLVVFIIILSVLVLIHEFGHFMVARFFGVKVEEFGLGLPPKLFGKKIGETEYTLNLLPFGGFVKLLGEDASGTQADKLLADTHSFVSKKPIQRALILLAGVFMNLIFAIAIYYALLATNNFKSVNIPLMFDYSFRFGTPKVTSTVIASMEKNSPLLAQNVALGEAIVEVDGSPVYSVLDIRNKVTDKVGETVSVVLVDKRKNSSKDNYRTITVVPIADTNGNGILGVYLAKSVVLDYSSSNDKFLSGIQHSYNMLCYSIHAFKSIVGLSVQTRDAQPLTESVAGPVGIYGVVGNILDYSGSGVWQSMLDFVALMSLSLAFINVMPFPALDGGRLVFVVYEMILGKRPNQKFEILAHRLGMMILLGLIVLVSVKDVLKLF